MGVFERSKHNDHCNTYFYQNNRKMSRKQKCYMTGERIKLDLESIYSKSAFENSNLHMIHNYNFN